MKTNIEIKRCNSHANNNNHISVSKGSTMHSTNCAVIDVVEGKKEKKTEKVLSAKNVHVNRLT